jgi:uncharacterized phiE125 gp8 family phage protein
VARYGLSLITAPTIEPVKLDEAKKQCELARADTYHDEHLSRLITAARQYVEERTNRALVTQTWDLFLDELPYTDSIWLPKPPLQSVTSLKYYDASGVQQTWSSANYIVSTSREPGRIALAYGISWPSVQARPDAVVVRFVCGYGTQSSIPERLKAAMLLLVAHWFEHRAEVVSVGQVSTVPTAAESLIEQAMIGDDFMQYAGCE